MSTKEENYTGLKEEKCEECSEKDEECNFCDKTGKIEMITSVTGFLKKLSAKSSAKMFYRGEKNFIGREIKPLIARKQKGSNDTIITYEHKMFREIISKCPEDFQDINSTFERLVKMQHYSLPTRLLDITSNALVALYFACKESSNKGIVYVFEIKQDKIKFFDSDTVCILSNLAKINKSLSDDEVKKQLLYQIRQEKFSFKDKINPNDLFSIQCVIPKLENRRIKAQSGAFFLFGMDKYNPNNAVPDIKKFEYITITKIIVDVNSKKQIIEELEKFNINEATLFPEMENMSKYIEKTYINAINETRNNTKNKFDAIENKFLNPKENEFPIQNGTRKRSCPTNKDKEHYCEFIIFEEFTEKQEVKNMFKFPEFVSENDRKEFIRLLFNSLSLSLKEKERVLNQSNSLNQFQVCALIDVWYEENIKFQSLVKEHPNDIAKLFFNTLSEWYKLIYNNDDFIHYFINKISECTVYPQDSIAPAFYAYFFEKVIEEEKSSLEDFKKIFEFIKSKVKNEPMLLALLKHYKKSEKIVELLNLFLSEKENDIQKDKYKKYYKYIGIFHSAQKNYKKAFYYFDKIKDDECLMDYVEVALLAEEINEAKQYLNEKQNFCKKEDDDYYIVFDLLEVIIDLIEGRKSIEEISKTTKTNWRRIENFQPNLSWSTTEINAIIKQKELTEKVKQCEGMQEIINKIAQGTSK